MAQSGNSGTENQVNEESSEKKGETKSKLWLTNFGTAVTILLTLFNAYIIWMNSDVENRNKEKTRELEESKERIARYTWVRSLLSDLDEKDSKKKEFTINLIRLALTREEGEQLFAGFKVSSSKELQLAGQSGISIIQNERIARLVTQLNAPTEDVSTPAVNSLLKEYKSSSTAISFVLGLFDEMVINTISPTGISNGLSFLKGTDPLVWNKQQIDLAKQAIKRIEAQGTNSKIQTQLKDFESFLVKLVT